MPAPGKYRLTQVAPPPSPTGHVCDVRVTPTGVQSPLLWYWPTGEEGAYTAAPGLDLALNADGTYVATGPNGTVTGTYAPVP